MSRGCTVPVTLLLLIGSPGCSVLEETWLTNEPLEGLQPRQVEATFAGNRNFSSRTLRKAIRPDMLGLSQGLDPDACAFDAADAIVDYYRAQGHPEASATYQVTGPTARAGNPDLVVVHFDIEEGPLVTVTDLDLGGNEAFDDDQLLPLWSRRNTGLFGLRDPMFVLDELRAFAGEIRSWYWRRGYMEVAVTDPEVEHASGERTAQVAIRIDEGRQFRFGRIDLAEPIRTALGDAVPALPTGEVFSTQRTQELLLAIRGQLLRRGHPQPKVGMSKLPDVTALSTAEIDLDVRGDPGPTAVFGAIEVVGNERTSTGYILSELGFAEGDPFNGFLEEKALEGLYRKGLFQRIKFDRGEIVDGRVPLRVEVQELEAQSIEVLAGYGSWERLRAGVRWEDRNLFGTGRELAIDGKISQRGYRASTTLTDRDLFDTDITGSIGLELYEREEPAFTDQAYGGVATVRRELTERIVGRVGYSLFRHKGSDLSPIATIGGDDYSSGTVFVELRRNTRDNFVLPNSGGNIYVRSDFTNPVFGATVEFTRLRTGAALIFPLGEHTGLTVNADVGWLFPQVRSVEVPIQERFFNGGFDTVRSYHQAQLGPKDLQGSPTGGEFRNVFNVELRQRLAGPLEGALFADAGNVGRRVEDYGFDDMGYAVGLGLRLRLPIGPVRLDAGWNPDPEPEDPDWVLHFAVGYPF